MQPKLHTKFISDDVSGVGNGFIQPGTVGASNAFGGFIVRTSLWSLDGRKLIVTENYRSSCWCQVTTSQDCSDASERAFGQDLQLLPKVQLLVYEGVA